MGMGRSKTNLSKWGYADTADTACECGTLEQTMQHLLRCPLLENECSLEDLATEGSPLCKSLASGVPSLGADKALEAVVDLYRGAHSARAPLLNPPK